MPKTKTIRAHYTYDQIMEIVARQLIRDKEPLYLGDADIEMTMMLNVKGGIGTVQRIQVEADLLNLHSDI